MDNLSFVSYQTTDVSYHKSPSQSSTILPPLPEYSHLPQPGRPQCKQYPEPWRPVGLPLEHLNHVVPTRGYHGHPHSWNPLHLVHLPGLPCPGGTEGQ